MRFLTYLTHKNELKQFINHQYPYHFQENFHRFETQKNKQIGILYDKESQIAIPIWICSKLFFTYIRLLYIPIKNGHSLSEKEEIDFYNHLIRFAKTELNAHRIISDFTIDISLGLPKKTTSCSFGQYYIPLQEKTEESIFQGFTSNYRNEIRKAIKEGAVVKFGEDQFDIFFNLYTSTLHRQGLSPYETNGYLKDLLIASTPEHAICGVVYYNDLPQGAILNFYSTYACYYYYSGSIEKPMLPGLVKLLQWEIIKIMSNKGVKQYILGGVRPNVEGTKYAGIQLFKKNFGSNLKEGYLWKIDIHPFYGKLYDHLLSIKLWLTKQPLYKDIIDQQREKNA